jgi:hypothetical protein
MDGMQPPPHCWFLIGGDPAGDSARALGIRTHGVMIEDGIRAAPEVARWRGLGPAHQVDALGVRCRGPVHGRDAMPVTVDCTKGWSPVEMAIRVLAENLADADRPMHLDLTLDGAPYVLHPKPHHRNWEDSFRFAWLNRPWTEPPPRECDRLTPTVAVIENAPDTLQPLVDVALDRHEAACFGMESRSEREHRERIAAIRAWEDANLIPPPSAFFDALDESSEEEK